MTEHNAGGYLQKFLPVIRPFAVYLYRFPVIFKGNLNLLIEGINEFYRCGTVLFAGTDQFSVPYPPKRRSIGTKVEGLKKIRLTLPVLTHQKNIFSRGIYLPIRKIPKGGGPQGSKKHGISGDLTRRLIELHRHHDMKEVSFGRGF
jgi:hypothetical protein